MLRWYSHHFLWMVDGLVVDSTPWIYSGIDAKDESLEVLARPLVRLRQRLVHLSLSSFSKSGHVAGIFAGKNNEKSDSLEPQHDSNIFGVRCLPLMLLPPVHNR